MRLPRPARRTIGVVALAAALAGCSDAGPATTASASASDLSSPVGTAGTRTVLSYGDAPEQVAELVVPAGAAGSPPVVVLVHGGYWRAGFDRSLEDDVAADLVADGYVVWNVDYRGVGATSAASEGGWPRTFEDVATAVDLLPDALADAGLGRGPTAVVGHSAGGALALWLASRPTLPDDAPGADPAVVPDLVVSQAGVDDLTTASAAGAGGGAVDALMGGSPAQVPDARYALADPTLRVPLGIPTLLVHGSADDVVPLSQSSAYADAARAAGDDDVTLDVVDSDDHGAHLDPTSASWADTRTWLDARLRP